MRGVYIPLSKKKIDGTGEERRVSKVMFLNKQEVLGSGAQVEGWIYLRA
jgi:hypothetical protein